MNLDRGSVVLVGLDPTVGHEQRGLRPCIAVSDKRRIHRLFGRVAADELAAIDQGLELFLGLGGA